jgi:hypothetical protein
MRKLIVVLSCLLFFCGGWCFGQQDSMTLNRTGWKSYDRLERLLFVTGFNKGHAAGMTEGFAEMLEAIMAVKPASSWTPAEKEKLNEKGEQLDRKADASYSGITVGQIEATVSTFYDDYRNMPVCWGDATRFCLSALKGNAPTEKELSAARKAGAESGCK